MVRDRGFEPLTPSVSRKCSTTELTAQPMTFLVNFGPNNNQLASKGAESVLSRTRQFLAQAAVH